jgi:hypothetical protein
MWLVGIATTCNPVFLLFVCVQRIVPDALKLFITRLIPLAPLNTLVECFPRPERFILTGTAEMQIP